MLQLSVIIITRNEALNIGDCIEAARLVSEDIVVVDSGSDDGTIEIIKAADAKLIQLTWQGFGFARNTAADNAKYDWVLAIDADERVTPALVDAIKNISSLDNKTIYGFRRQNYFMGKKMLFGKWGRDFTFRLYNKRFVCWDLTEVHEVLIGQSTIKTQLKNGYIKHYPVRELSVNDSKTERYARLNAGKYFSYHKKATLVKRFLSPASDFLQSYIVRLGFLDGKEGFIVSWSNAKYTYLKYKYLLEKNKEAGRQ